MSTNSVESEEVKLTPEQLLMNCLADAGRIKNLVVIVQQGDGHDYEVWSNNLPAHERIGLMNIGRWITKKRLRAVDEEE